MRFRFKKVLSFLCVLILLAGLATAAYAIDDGFDIPIPNEDGTLGTSSYTYELVYQLISDSDIIVDGVVTQIAADGDDIKCKVTLNKAYRPKIAPASVPLSYNIILPKGSVKKNAKVLLFLRRDDALRTFVKTINDGSLISFIYKSEDYTALLGSVSSHPYTRAQLLQWRDIPKYPDAGKIAANYEKANPGSINSVYFDENKVQHMIVLTKNTKASAVRRYMKANAKNSHLYRVVEANKPTAADLNIVLRSIQERVFHLVLNEQANPELLSIKMYVNEKKKNITVEIPNLTDQKIQEFKTLVDDCVWLSFIEYDPDNDIDIPLPG